MVLLLGGLKRRRRLCATGARGRLRDIAGSPDDSWRFERDVGSGGVGDRSRRAKTAERQQQGGTVQHDAYLGECLEPSKRRILGV